MTLLLAARAPLGGHLWHIIALAAWVPIFGFVLLFEQGKRRHRAGAHNLAPTVAASKAPMCESHPPATTHGSAWLQGMALASIGAALVHVAVSPDHFRESGLYGGFFVVAAASQIGFAVLLLSRPSRQLVIAGVVGSAVMVILWLFTRTVGVPIGPDNGSTESFGVLDILASVYETAAVVFGVIVVRRLSAAPAWRWSKWTPALRLAAPCFLVGTVAASLLGSRS